LGITSIQPAFTNSIKRLNRNSKVFKVALDAIREKKGENIVSLDLRKIDEAVADFFIICEAQSHVQIKAIADNVVEKMRELCEERPYHYEQSGTWTLVDYINIVVHVFHPEERKFYDMEGLWMDAGRQDHTAS
jgi:ribosome-associated protein